MKAKRKTPKPKTIPVMACFGPLCTPRRSTWQDVRLLQIGPRMLRCGGCGRTLEPRQVQA